MTLTLKRPALPIGLALLPAPVVLVTLFHTTRVYTGKRNRCRPAGPGA